MSTAHDVSQGFEAFVAESFGNARQGAVLVVEAPHTLGARAAWLERQLPVLVPGALHVGPDGLYLLIVPHVGAAEAWLLVEHLRRQLERAGWEGLVVASASWPLQGSSPMDAVAASLAALLDERTNMDALIRGDDGSFMIGDEDFSFGNAGELLTG